LPRSSPRGPYYRLNVFSIFMPPCATANPTSCCWATISSPSTPGSTSGRSGASRPRHRHAGQLSGPARARAGNTLERRWPPADGQVDPWPPLPPTLQTAEASGTVVSDFAVPSGRAYRRTADRGRAEERARQPREGGAATREHRADHQATSSPPDGSLAPARNASGAICLSEVSAVPAVRRRSQATGPPTSALRQGRHHLALHEAPRIIPYFAPEPNRSVLPSSPRRLRAVAARALQRSTIGPSSYCSEPRRTAKSVPRAGGLRPSAAWREVVAMDHLSVAGDHRGSRVFLQLAPRCRQ